MSWIDSVRGTDSIREVARRAGLNQATLNRQVNLDVISYDVVRDIARAYQRPVLADLVATGHLSHEDVGLSDIESALHAASDDQLVMEIARRLDAPVVSSLFERPVSEAIETASNVHHLRPRNVSRSAEDMDMREVASRDFEINPDQDDHDWDA